MDERNYNYIIRTGFWRKRKGESKGQTNKRAEEWMNEWRKKNKSAVNERWNNGGNDKTGRSVK